MAKVTKLSLRFLLLLLLLASYFPFRIFFLKYREDIGVQDKYRNKEGIIIPASSRLHLLSYLKGKSVVLVGPSEECTVRDFSDLVMADSVMVRPNLKQKNGNVLISEKVLLHVANRTDIVYHHAATAAETGIMNRKWRSETAISSETVEAYKKSGIKYVVCAEPFRCEHAKTYAMDGLKMQDLHSATKLWMRKGMFSTGLKAIVDLLNYPIINMTIICLDFHQGGTRKSYDKLYGDLSVPEDFSQGSVSLEEQSGVHNFRGEFEEFKRIHASEKDRIILTGKLASMMETTTHKEEGTRPISRLL